MKKGDVFAKPGFRDRGYNTNILGPKYSNATKHRTSKISFPLPHFLQTWNRILSSYQHQHESPQDK